MRPSLKVDKATNTFLIPTYFSKGQNSKSEKSTKKKDYHLVRINRHEVQARMIQYWQDRVNGKSGRKLKLITKPNPNASLAYVYNPN